VPNTTVTKGRDADLLSIPEAAALPGLSAETAYRLARRGELPGAVKLGRSWLISRPRLLAHFTETAAHDRWVWADTSDSSLTFWPCLARQFGMLTVTTKNTDLLGRIEERRYISYTLYLLGTSYIFWRS